MLRTSSDLTRPVFPPPGAKGNSNGRFFLRLSGERGLFGLAPGGVYLAAPIARGTGELLPRLFTLTLWNRHNGHSTGRYVFCGTFLIPKPCVSGFRDSPGYGPPCPVELGLSSPPDHPSLRDLRRSDHLFPVNSSFPSQAAQKRPSAAFPSSFVAAAYALPEPFGRPSPAPPRLPAEA